MSDDDEPTLDLEAPDDVGSAAGIRRRAGKLDREKQRTLDFWKAVFADPVGRREMWALLQQAHAFEERFACGPNGFPQPEATWFNAGQQALGQRLYQTWLRMDIGGVRLMHDECDPNFAKSK